jgi:hypothetical protein
VALACLNIGIGEASKGKDVLGVNTIGEKGLCGSRRGNTPN